MKIKPSIDTLYLSKDASINELIHIVIFAPIQNMQITRIAINSVKSNGRTMKKTEDHDNGDIT